MPNHKSQDLIIFGRNPVIEAIAEGKEIERVYVRDNMTGEAEIAIRQSCKAQDVTLKKVPQAKLDKLVRGRNHQGVVAVMSMVTYEVLDDVIPHLFEQGIAPIIVLLDNVQDVGNIGAILRSCEVLGAHAVILSGKRSGYVNQDAYKSSAGAAGRITLCKEKNTIDAIQKLQNWGVKVVGSGLIARARKDINQSLAAPVALVIGNEGDGLHISVLNACDEVVQIPQYGQTDSLNVSVATGIILYEIKKQSLDET